LCKEILFGSNNALSIKSAIIITHYQKLLEYVVPDKVHVLKNGRIVRTGGKEIIDIIENEGFDKFRED